MHCAVWTFHKEVLLKVKICGNVEPFDHFLVQRQFETHITIIGWNAARLWGLMIGRTKALWEMEA